jgi:hypothetical protein
MEENMVFDSVRDEYFERLMRMLLFEFGETDLIDDIWVSGIVSRKLFVLLSPIQQATIRNIDTNTARCWLNGIEGLDWDHGFVYK